MDVAYVVETQGLRLDPAFAAEPLVAVSVADDFANSVRVVQLQYHRANHVVEPRAEPAARVDGDRNRARERPSDIGFDLHQHLGGVRYIVGDFVVGNGGQLQRRGDGPLAERLHYQLLLGRHEKGSPWARPLVLERATTDELAKDRSGRYVLRIYGNESVDQL